MQSSLTFHSFFFASKIECLILFPTRFNFPHFWLWFHCQKLTRVCMLLALRLTSRVTWSSKSGMPVMFVCWSVAGWLNISARPVSLSTYPASCRLLPRFSPVTSVCDRSACRVRSHCRLPCIWCWVVRLLDTWSPVLLIPFSRRHLSYDDCLEDKRKDCQNCSVLWCALQ